MRIACELNVLARKKNKHLLLYVHGYNNDMPDVIGTCMALEKLYNVIVVPFFWPANGGGASGAAAYVSDKRDARASADALRPRNRLYVVINEDDFALKWSRRKPGDEQLARLGHYLKNLVARSAYYINVTNASWVK